MSTCPSNTNLIIKKPTGRLLVIPLMNYQYNLLAVKRMIEDKEFIQMDQQELTFCNEKLEHDHQGIDIYHRYFHQKYGKCMYMLSIKLNFK